MRLSRKRRHQGLAMNMTPMIDVVFQLLIFFLTVSQVSRVSNEQLELPQLAGSQDQVSATLTVNITVLQELIVDGQRRTLAEVASLVSGLVRENGQDPQRVTIVLRVDRRAVSQIVNQVVAELNTIGITRIRIGVEVPT